MPGGMRLQWPVPRTGPPGQPPKSSTSCSRNNGNKVRSTSTNTPPRSWSTGTNDAATPRGSGWDEVTMRSARARRRRSAGSGWKCLPPNARRSSMSATPDASTTKYCEPHCVAWTSRKRRSGATDFDVDDAGPDQEQSADHQHPDRERHRDPHAQVAGGQDGEGNDVAEQGEPLRHQA